MSILLAKLVSVSALVGPRSSVTRRQLGHAGQTTVVVRRACGRAVALVSGAIGEI